MTTLHEAGGRRHALVVGGTGMLKGLTLSLATQGYTVSVVARNVSRLQMLVDAAHGSAGRINPLAVDYRHGVELREKLTAASETYGPFGLAVCWIHSTAPDALRQVAEVVGTDSQSCRLFHVRGSAAANPANAAKNVPEWLSNFPNIRYRQVILGFVVERGTSRWLSHQEISDGVAAAVREDAPYYVVGTVEPWSLRP